MHFTAHILIKVKRHGARRFTSDVTVNAYRPECNRLGRVLRRVSPSLGYTSLLGTPEYQEVTTWAEAARAGVAAARKWVRENREEQMAYARKLERLREDNAVYIAQLASELWGHRNDARFKLEQLIGKTLEVDGRAAAKKGGPELPLSRWSVTNDILEIWQTWAEDEARDAQKVASNGV